MGELAVPLPVPPPGLVRIMVGEVDAWCPVGLADAGPLARRAAALAAWRRARWRWARTVRWGRGHERGLSRTGLTAGEFRRVFGEDPPVDWPATPAGPALPLTDE